MKTKNSNGSEKLIYWRDQSRNSCKELNTIEYSVEMETKLEVEFQSLNIEEFFLQLVYGRVTVYVSV